MITQMHYRLTRFTQNRPSPQAMAMAGPAASAAAFVGDSAPLLRQATAPEGGGAGGSGGMAQGPGTARRRRTASAKTRNPTRLCSFHENMWLHVWLRSMTYKVKSLIDQGNLPTILAHSSAVGSHKDHTR
uniref:Uncharacterized protein n=1 Tax=Oryza punctata TaxID=4537 RepID=A0A0E0JZE6_ORYPU